MKNKLSLFVLSVIIPFSAIFAQKNNWAQYRGPNADGISTETGINKDWKAKPPKVLWKITMTDMGYSVPSVAEGKVYLLDHANDKDIVKCLNLDTGKELWKFEYPDEKKQKWGFTRSQPLYDNAKIYITSRKGKVFCLDAKTGEKKWEIDFQKDFNGKLPRWGFTASAVIDGDKLILCPIAKNNMIITVDKNTGKILWRGGGNIDIGYSVPTVQKVNGKKQYVLANTKGLAGISPKNGKVLWSTAFTTKYGCNIAVPVVFEKNKIFITAAYNHGCAVFQILENKATKLWENSKMQSHFNSPVVIDNSIYGIGDPGKLICMDSANGNIRWGQRGFGKGGIIIIDGTIIAVDGNSGKVIMVKSDPEKYIEMGRISPLSKDKKSWVPPIVADKKLLVRNRTELACLDISE